MRSVKHILVIDNDEETRDRLVPSLGSAGFKVTVAVQGQDGMRLLGSDAYDTVLTELDLPDIDGGDLVMHLLRAPVPVPVILLTSLANAHRVATAIRNGAADYLAKPADSHAVIRSVRRACESRSTDNAAGIRGKSLSFEGLIGDSLPMQRVYEMIDKIADTDSTVLITGESGTGKELVARTIHARSSRRDNPFVPLNCAAIPRDLLESELFGHERGAFTGALFTRTGRFELAHRGTLFLDEIGELDPSLQVKLLRVIQEREFERVGGVKTIKTDVRIIAATNTDLEKSTKEGKFREDLFYRLNVLPLHIPPLRRRIEDLQPLIDHFVQVFAKRRKRAPFVFSRESMEVLMDYRWPGNVRELENLVERLSILTTAKTVTCSDLPDQFHKDRVASREGDAAGQGVFAFPQLFLLPEHGIDLHDLLRTIERNLIEQALDRSHGVRSRAAAILGLNRTTLIEKMKKMGFAAARGGQVQKPQA